MKARIRRTFTLLLFSLFLVSAAVCTEQHKRILVLNSYHEGFHWTDRIMSGIKIGFQEHENIELYINYMDTKRHVGEQYFGLLNDLYRYKYGAFHFDAIITTDDNALDFMLKYKDGLFPDVPVVFTGINDFHQSRITGSSGYTGTAEGYDLEGTLDLILRQHPDTSRVAVIADHTVSGDAMVNRVRRAENKFMGILKIEYLVDLTLDELESRLSDLADDTVVLWAIYLRTKNGDFLTVKESLSFVEDATARPVYAPWDVVGMGVIGGIVSNPEYLGEHAAARCLEVLNGKDPDEIPVDFSPMTYIFDYRKLKEFGIKTVALPSGSLVLNIPGSFFRENSLIVMLAAAAFIMLLVIIIILQINRIKHRRKNTIIASTLEERTVLLRELYHRTKNNMQMLISMMSLTRAYSENDELKTVLKELENKIFSISLVHAKLYRSGNLSSINLKEFLADLSTQICNSYSIRDKAIELIVEVPEIEINIDLAIPLGLIINELLSNTFKHAFPGHYGEIQLKVRPDGTDLIVDYKDNGIGVGKDFDIFSTNSLGLKTVKEIVTNQLSGTIAVDTGSGLWYRMMFGITYISRV